MKTLAVLAFSMLASFSTWGAAADTPVRTARPMKIGIIGTGDIGGALARHWARAGHELLISSRHPEKLQDLARELGPKVKVGTPREAAAFGEVVLVSVPYHATPQVGRDFSTELKGKVVLDTGNPYPSRDGEMAVRDRERGTGVASKEYLPGTKLVRAFNAINAGPLAEEAFRKPDRIGIPLASDHADALKVAEQLVSDAGFDPVVVGGLARAREFDYGTPVYVRSYSAAKIREVLGLKVK
jgi:8-hydroxy-5-deazaflavin:NADPH oxidoreductase